MEGSMLLDYRPCEDFSGTDNQLILVLSLQSIEEVFMSKEVQSYCLSCLLSILFCPATFLPKDAGNIGHLHMVPLMEAVTFFWRYNDLAITIAGRETRKSLWCPNLARWVHSALR